MTSYEMMRNPEGVAEYSTHEAAKQACFRELAALRPHEKWDSCDWYVSGPSTGMGGALVYRAHVSTGATGWVL